MPSWLIPALKAILPHVGTIVDAAKPVFTRKKPAGTAGTDVAAADRRAAGGGVAERRARARSWPSSCRARWRRWRQSAALAESRLRRATLFSASISLAVSIAALLVAACYLRLGRARPPNRASIGALSVLQPLHDQPNLPRHAKRPRADRQAARRPQLRQLPAGAEGQARRHAAGHRARPGARAGEAPRDARWSSSSSTPPASSPTA